MKGESRPADRPEQQGGRAVMKSGRSSGGNVSFPPRLEISAEWRRPLLKCKSPAREREGRRGRAGRRPLFETGDRRFT